MRDDSGDTSAPTVTRAPAWQLMEHLIPRAAICDLPPAALLPLSAGPMYHPAGRIRSRERLSHRPVISSRHGLLDRTVGVYQVRADGQVRPVPLAAPKSKTRLGQLPQPGLSNAKGTQW